ncbi:DUF5020 family protein [Draconibacterium sp. IB214405]|uniref:DUF5020 family protein n=1 Tax=Draconibacterium sp. IB214405 TaxID=3097352 RepID=UPI002A11C161|nr:DUF5020 family protein [Draconibacterium sp. IB214405]MDX8338030.1 DUF5020 family protein [Draconibacterium sp. IB214405]
MKKVLLAMAFVAFMFSVNAQNLQLHYDFGEGRKMLTSTVEMFRPDAYGSTFFFVDMDYGSDESGIDNGVSLAYWEIARAFKWNETQSFMPRVEYNGGIMVLDGANFPIENCWLAGVERTWASADFSKILTLQANYKYIKDKEDAAFQLTAVWTVQMAEGKVTFTGFADFWKEEMFWGTDYRFLTEPQLWYNPCKNFSFGTEVELSNNFVGDEFAVKPTLAVKYTF